MHDPCAIHPPGIVEAYGADKPTCVVVIQNERGLKLILGHSFMARLIAKVAEEGGAMEQTASEGDVGGAMVVYHPNMVLMDQFVKTGKVRVHVDMSVWPARGVE